MYCICILINLSSRVVFTREKFLYLVCSLPHGNHSDSNNPLTKMHMLTHIGHLKYNVQKSMKSSRPLVDTFRMYLCADTDTFSQNVSVPIQIQYQKMYLCADTDTFSDNFWLIFYQNILRLKSSLIKCGFEYPFAV